MDIAFVVDPVGSLEPHKDSTVVIMREAAARGHGVFAFESRALVWGGGHVRAKAKRLKVSADDANWCQVMDETQRDLVDFGAVVMRKDPPYDMEYLYTTYLLEMAQAQGATVWSSPRALRDFNEKLGIARFPQFIAPTLVTSSPAEIRAFLDEHREIVLKPLDMFGGKSVFLVTLLDPNVDVIIETVTHDGTRTVMAQRFLPEVRSGDRRVYVVAGQPAPFSLVRIPRDGSVRANIAVGSEAVAQPLTEWDREVARVVGPELVANGVLLVGLDLIGPHLTEVSVGSVAGLRVMLDQTGFNIASMILDVIERPG